MVVDLYNSNFKYLNFLYDDLVGLTTSSFIIQLGKETPTFWIAIAWAIVATLIYKTIQIGKIYHFKLYCAFAVE